MLEATQLTLALLDELGLKVFLKTSGGKGMHLVVPLTRRAGWAEVKDFSHALVEHMAGLFPDRFSAVSGPKNRIGRIFIDYLRNGRVLQPSPPIRCALVKGCRCRCRSGVRNWRSSRAPINGISATCVSGWRRSMTRGRVWQASASQSLRGCESSWALPERLRVEWWLLTLSRINRSAGSPGFAMITSGNGHTLLGKPDSSANRPSPPQDALCVRLAAGFFVLAPPVPARLRLSSSVKSMISAPLSSLPSPFSTVSILPLLAFS